METIREVGLSICVTAVASAIFQGLLPKSPMEKTARFVLSVFILSCLVVPFLEYDWSSLESVETFRVMEEQEQTEGFQEIVDQKLLELSVQTVSAQILEKLETAGIVPAEEIRVAATIEEDHCIKIDQATVSVRREDYSAAVCLLNDSFGKDSVAVQVTEE